MTRRHRRPTSGGRGRASAPLPQDPGPAQTTGAVIDALSSGAVGDGIADDTLALQSALDALVPGSTLLLPAGHVFAHSDVLRIRVPGVVVTGGGTLLATQEARSEVWIDADRVLVQDVVVRTARTTRRWDAYEQMGLRLGAHDGITVRRVEIAGSAAAGIYAGGSRHFLLDQVDVHDTRSDGIHLTEASSDGIVRNSHVARTGDDGVAIVSYGGVSGVPVARISVIDTTVVGGAWGRAFSVVGGEDVSYTRITARNSSAAALYFSTEGNYNTTSTRRVTVDGATLINSNTLASCDQGSILLYNGGHGASVTDVTLRNITIQSTRGTASRDVGVIDENGTVARVSMSGFTLSGGPDTSYYGASPAGSVIRQRWTKDGVPLTG